ncbi:hypothetical protein N7478_001900 [Penicillium angulare]|uniref:uncharacterized protein n=1 Tax=Penicillium angulare TaxID=116970 RepID=UPI002542252C|nr:uncharacterized protein N7478_001900 [Penicillium angulare]KAJ5288870.1 hypothetical protein N7478_001900 [Penicillium angulare]
MNQVPLLEDTSRHGCRHFWDANNAWISPCALPYLAIAPATVAVLITLGHLLRPIFRRWRPTWLHSFISEQDEQQDIPPDGAEQPLHWTVALLGCSAFGISTETLQLVPPGFDIPSLILLVSWTAICTLIAIKRPRSCSISLLSYFLSVSVVETILAAHFEDRHGSKVIARYISAGASLVGCCTILLMPFRNASLPVSDISGVGQTPSDKLRSPEDNLRLWQFLTVSWMTPLISLGRKRQLNEPDIWSLGFEFQHRRLHEKFRQMRGSVLIRVLKANSVDVLIISTIAIVQLFCQFSIPVLLQPLLHAMQDDRKSKRVPMTYALILLIIRLVAAQSQVLGLWYGRRCYERSRGEMVMMVYEKALSRKNIIGLRVDGEQVDGDDTSVPEVEFTPKKPSIWKRLVSRNSKKKPTILKEPASMGKIFNLLRGDVYEVAQRFWEVDTLIDGPAGLFIAVGLVWALFGPSCFLGILAILLGQALNAVITRTLFQWEKTRRAATDNRLQITSQFVEAIRHLRWYGWQNHWLRQVMEARQHELNLRIITSLWNIVIRFVNAFSSGVFPVIALYAYTMIAGHELRIDTIFPALQLFAMLESRLRDLPRLITSLINAYIALARIEDFMAEPDKEQPPIGRPVDDMNFEMQSCSFAWPGKIAPVLSDLNAKFPRGLTVVTGKVGSGKTALLQALLGELDLLSGKLHIPNEMMGYCAQTPWLQSMSIRDNILFSAPYEEVRYKHTLEACALLPDLAQFKHGDLSFIGENGIGLSGGQKARVALARAVYSSSRVLLLDDPLSALDHNTAEFVVRKCLSGQLMQNRTIILVTHRTALVQEIADQIIQISEGGALVHDKSAISKSINHTSHESNPLFQNLESDDLEDINVEDHANAVPDKFIEEEHRAEWGVKARVYWTYIKAGKYRWWLILVLILTIYRLANVGQSWFLKGWGEAYNDTSVALNDLPRWRGAVLGDIMLKSTPTVDKYFLPQDLMYDLPSPRDDVRPWLWTFFAIASFQAVTLLLAQLLMLVIIYSAGKALFQQVMKRVSHATFRFFDVTPVGRLMNRLTSDIGVVDGNISEQFQVIAFQAITWISSMLVIASTTPAFLASALALTIAFILIFLWFLPTSQSLRRLEMVSLTPLLSNFGELLHGLTTVRAFRAEGRFQNRVISVVDKFQGMDHFYWSLQAWLISRFETLSAFSTFCLIGLALYTDTTPGMMAFVLIAANNFVDSTHQLCKQYGQLQMDFVSVERIDELLHIEEESAGTIEPSAAWPTYGKDIVFEDVTIRYAPHLEPSLTDVSLRIPGGSTAAVVGRTGSGKSTLAVSLLSVIKPETGRVIIDGINIAEVSTQALRTRVTFVAQDPILFPGSIRLNLDPTEEFSDEQCAEILDRLCGRHGWRLDTYIEAGGRNLSQGQRQLIALTRAVLRRSPIVILDEATASIDHETSLEMQQIVREELQSSTVITIAHRIEAVKDADYFIVLDQGRVARQGYVRDL